jgi:hypothetical protein
MGLALMKQQNQIRLPSTTYCLAGRSELDSELRYAIQALPALPYVPCTATILTEPAGGRTCKHSTGLLLIVAVLTCAAGAYAVPVSTD